IVKSSNDIQSNREFLGYEFKKGRQAGMVVYRDSEDKDKTALYDEDNLFNSDKVNYYIYQSFLGNIETPTDAVQDYVSLVDLVDSIDFKRVEFDKQISLSTKTKINFQQIWQSKFNLIKLSEVANFERGTSITKASVKQGNIPVIAAGMQPAYYHNVSNFEGNIITISASGANAGYVNYHNYPIFASDCFVIQSKNTNEILTKIIFYFLKLIQDIIYQLQRGQAQPHVYISDLQKIQIPLPPKEVQEQIIQEIEVLETREQELRNNIEQLQTNIQERLNDSFNTAPKIKLSQAAFLERGRFSHRPRNAPHLYQDGTYPFIQTGDVAKVKGRNIIYSQTLNEEGLKVSKLFEPETILITIAANIGSTAILTYPACFPDSIVSIKPNEQMNIDYLEYYLRTQQQYLNDIAPQKAQKNINLEILRPLLVACPEKNEQDRIINEVLDMEKYIQNYEQEIQAIPQQKEAILQKYL
ncbi:MAG: restriction endonuclease subunit S, partial [Dolichospermum sp.]